MRAFTVGHGRREAEELVTVLREAGARTVVDVRRFPASRRNPPVQPGARVSVRGDVRPGESEAHPLSLDADSRAGKLFLCGVEVA